VILGFALLRLLKKGLKSEACPDDGKACGIKVGGDPPDFAESKVVVHQKLSHKTWSREKQFVLPHQ